MNNIYKANYKENRGVQTPQNKKLNFNNIKNNAINSLAEVGYFFDNFSHFMKYIKLYKILK